MADELDQELRIKLVRIVLMLTAVAMKLVSPTQLPEQLFFHRVPRNP
jgi:uncharacterized membrane protein